MDKIIKILNNIPKINLMIDSGAFSVLSRRINIDIHKYSKFIDQNNDIIDFAVNLDIIPNNKSYFQYNDTAQQSFINYNILQNQQRR